MVYTHLGYQRCPGSIRCQRSDTQRYSPPEQVLLLTYLTYNILLTNCDRWMAAFSAIFVLATGLFYKSGLEDASLIYANVVNLVSRILFAAHFISQYYRQHGNGSLFVWSSVPPRWPFIALVGLSGFVLRASAAIKMDDLKQGRGFDTTSYIAVLRHFATGACLAMVCIAVWWVQTGRYLVFPDRKRT
jgi:hypothetical protein